MKSWWLFLIVMRTVAGRGVVNETKNQTEEAGEADLKSDGVWEKMVNVAWLDYITTINREKELYGVSVEPLELSPILGNNVKISRTILAYQVNFTFNDMWSHGLSSLQLKEVTFKRDENLTQVRTHALLAASEIELIGKYTMEGRGDGAWSWFGTGTISSEGEQVFRIKLKDTVITTTLSVDLVTGCQDNQYQESAVVTEIDFPLEYGSVEFDFENLGSVLSVAVDVVGRIVIDSQKEALVAIIKDGIARESPGLICDTWKKMSSSRLPLSSRFHYKHNDHQWNAILSREAGILQRDMLAEQTVETVFKESILSHLNNISSPVRQKIDPLQLFPLEFDFKNDVYKANVEACDIFAHNFKSINDLDMMLVRDKSLNFSALRVSIELPISWMTGNYKMKNAYFFGFIPAGAGGHFNVDIKHIKARMIIVLRKTNQDLVLEHFEIDSDWENVAFMFDGLWSGWGEFADLVMNELGVGGVIVQKQKRYILGEIKTYLRGMAECAMRKPALGLELCMRQYWINLGWTYPWEYPVC